MQAVLETPYADDDALPATPGGIQIVQLQGRAASQLVDATTTDADYEEIPEAIVQSAPTGKRRSTVGAADRCHRPAPTGGTCTNSKVNGRNFCTSHLCEHPGCNQAKSSRVTACPTHLVVVAAGGNAGSGLASGSLYTNDAYSNVPGSTIAAATAQHGQVEPDQNGAANSTKTVPLNPGHTHGDAPLYVLPDAAAYGSPVVHAAATNDVQSAPTGSGLVLGSLYSNDSYGNISGSTVATTNTPNSGQGIRRGSDARKKGSVYEGFGGSAGAGADDGELEC
jgi:hypothetical protein